MQEGGSSITQQLVKNFFLTPERTFKRKLQEMMIAVVLETKLSKEGDLSALRERNLHGPVGQLFDQRRRRSGIGLLQQRCGESDAPRSALFSPG